MLRLVAWSSTGTPGQVTDLTLTKIRDADEYLRFSPSPSSCVPKGVQRGFAPLRHFYLPKNGGSKGVEVCH